MAGYKPGYVVVRARRTCLVIYLGVRFPVSSSSLPSGVVELTLGRAALIDAGILDLATRKTCGATGCPAVRWSLTPPFHPYLLVQEAVVFCHVTLRTFGWDNPTVPRRVLPGTALYVARTFLMPHT